MEPLLGIEPSSAEYKTAILAIELYRQIWYTRVDSNHRPFAYQANATNQAELRVYDFLQTLYFLSEEIMVIPRGIEPRFSG